MNMLKLTIQTTTDRRKGGDADNSLRDPETTMNPNDKETTMNTTTTMNRSIFAGRIKPTNKFRREEIIRQARNIDELHLALPRAHTRGAIDSWQREKISESLDEAKRILAAALLYLEMNPKSGLRPTLVDGRIRDARALIGIAWPQIRRGSDLTIDENGLIVDRDEV